MFPMVVIPDYEFKDAISDTRLRGLLRMLSGFRLKYIGPIASLALATAAKTATFVLLAYFVDTVLARLAPQPEFLMPDGTANPLAESGPDTMTVILGVALGLIGLALVEGFFSFQSGRLAARTGEGVARQSEEHTSELQSRENLVCRLL